MKISVPSLQSGRHVFESSEAPTDYGESAAASGLCFCGNIVVRAVVNKMANDLFVRADVRTSVRAQCGRCTKEFDQPVTGTIEALYVPDQQRDMDGPAAHRAEGESQRLLYYSGGVVDLGEQIFESLSLAVPMKPLCRADCKGLCPHCGRNRNEGPCSCTEPDDFNKPFRKLFPKDG